MDCFESTNLEEDLGKGPHVQRPKSGAFGLGLLLLLGCGVVPSACGRPGGDGGQTQSTTALLPPSKTLPPFTTREHFRLYADTTFVPFALLGPLTGAALSQWVTGSPPQWGQGLRGYGRRALSGYSRQVIANTIALGAAFADGEDPRHYPTGRHGIWRRGLYAARETFISHRTSGGDMPAYSRVIGAYGAAFAANAWYPAEEPTSDMLFTEARRRWPQTLSGNSSRNFGRMFSVGCGVGRRARIAATDPDHRRSTSGAVLAAAWR